MKKIILSVILLFSGLANAQNVIKKFEVVKLGTKYSKETIETSFSKANLCGSFLETKVNQIILNDGAIINLFPKSIIGNSTDVTEDCFLPDNSNLSHISWSILPNGFVGKAISKKPNKSYIITTK